MRRLQAESCKLLSSGLMVERQSDVPKGQPPDTAALGSTRRLCPLGYQSCEASQRHKEEQQDTQERAIPESSDIYYQQLWGYHFRKLNM